MLQRYCCSSSAHYMLQRSWCKCSWQNSSLSGVYTTMLQRSCCSGSAPLARYVANVSPTCRRHRKMSPNLGRHCMSLRHRRGPDIPNFPQLQPTSTNQPKHTSTLAMIFVFELKQQSRNYRHVGNFPTCRQMSGISRHVVKCRVV